MEELEILVTMKNGVKLPGYATISSSGMDLCAFIEEPVTIEPLDRALIPTGIFMSIPPGYEAEIRPRSGIANAFGVTVLNTPGTIDADYRGEIKVILVNFGKDPFVVRNMDRIAQMVFRNVARAQFRVVEKLEDTKRGEGGFGSTGI